MFTVGIDLIHIIGGKRLFSVIYSFPLIFKAYFFILLVIRKPLLRYALLCPPKSNQSSDIFIRIYQHRRTGAGISVSSSFFGQLADRVILGRIAALVHRTDCQCIDTISGMIQILSK